MTSPSTKRRDMDIMKLMMSDYKVTMANEDSTSDFYVKFEGPKDSPYENGVWNVHVTIPSEYPYRSPSIGFCNTIFHPNVDEASGSVCLDVINQTWSPMFDLVNIFGVFLPQLLLYPNPSDPLNGSAAAILMSSKEAYHKKVKEYVEKFAQSNMMSDDQTDEGEAVPPKETENDSQPVRQDELSDIDDFDMEL